MELEIVVCIKQVLHPEYYAQAQIDPITKALKREAYPAIMNPLDKHAIEAALQIKEKHRGRVKVISMGPLQVEETLREALSMGVDEAILLCDPVFAGADTLATSFVLATGIRTLGKVDLILCGNETADSGTGQVGPQLAYFLKIPMIMYVHEIEQIQNYTVRVKRVTEYGELRMETQLPVLLAVVQEINTPRYPSLGGIADAATKSIFRLTAKDLNLKECQVGIKGSPTQTEELVLPELKKRRGEILKGSPDEMTKQLIQKLRKHGGI